jgi:Zn-dependent peptidase ImmA (M78 family)
MSMLAHKFVSRSFGFGDRAIFQCRVDLSPEADDPYVTPEEAASWGSLELWAGGRNLTAHYEAGELLGTVSWYLLPVFEWLAEQWDFLFHEQRPPTAFEGDNAWASLDRTHHPDYFERFGAQADKVAEENYEWSRRHCLWSAGEGGIFPDIVIRRDRDEVEISWGAARPAGTPDHFFFANGPGVVRLPPREVAEAFYQALRAASATLCESLPNSARVRALSQRVEKLSRPQLRDKRMAILAGLGADFAQWRKRWGHLRTKLVKDFAPLVGWFEGEVGDTLVISGNCEGALMFGSAAPTLREKDVFAIAEKLVEHSQAGITKDALAEHAASTPLQSIPFEDGYRLAADWADTSNLWGKMPQPVDIEKHLTHFGVVVSDVTLGDEDIGGVAVARSGLAPLILVNTTNPRNAYPSGRRFTLAHELCHLLHDRDRARNVALISGPWAPPGIEKRANAFAARLLMPGALLDAAFAEQGAKAHNPSFEQLVAVAQQLDVSVDALAHHMANLGYLSPAHRDRLLDALPIKTGPRK